MGKARQTNKEPKKQANLTLKEKRAAKKDKKGGKDTIQPFPTR